MRPSAPLWHRLFFCFVTCTMRDKTQYTYFVDRVPVSNPVYVDLTRQLQTLLWISDIYSLPVPHKMPVSTNHKDGLDAMKCIFFIWIYGTISNVPIIIHFDLSSHCNAGFILCMRPANERRRYIVTSSLIGRTHTQNEPCNENACEMSWCHNVIHRH